MKLKFSLLQVDYESPQTQLQIPQQIVSSPSLPVALAPTQVQVSEETLYQRGAIATSLIVLVLVGVQVYKPVWNWVEGKLPHPATSISSRDRTPTATTPVTSFVKPVNAPEGSPFGVRYHPIDHIYKMHDGLDFAASMGQKVKSSIPGTVTFAGRKGGYGNLVEVSNGHTATRYGHLSEIAVKVGEKVQQGEKIGEVGSTGHSTGPHLHFEVRVNGTPVNPEKYLARS